MEILDSFKTDLQKVQDWRATNVPSVFKAATVPSIKGIDLSGEEPDQLGYFTLNVGEVSVKAPIMRGVARNLSAYDLVLCEAIKEVASPTKGAAPIVKKGHLAWRLVAPMA